MDALYIADGHHRAAAGATIARRRRNPSQPQQSDRVLAVFFPHDQLKVAITTAVAGLRGLSTEAFLEIAVYRDKGFNEKIAAAPA